jgi:hypothetical protein
MLGYLVVLAAVMLLVTDLINMMLKTAKETATRDTLIQRVDSAIDQLRRDTWSASRMTAAHDHLELTTSAGTIVWQMTADKKLIRNSPLETPRIWIQMPPLTFEAKGPTVTLGVESGTGGAKRESVTFISQQLAADSGRGAAP